MDKQPDRRIRSLSILAGAALLGAVTPASQCDDVRDYAGPCGAPHSNRGHYQPTYKAAQRKRMARAEKNRAKMARRRNL